MAKTVLIVDDNEFSRQALCELFQQADFEICADAENGREAIEMAGDLTTVGSATLDLAGPVNECNGDVTTVMLQGCSCDAMTRT